MSYVPRKWQLQGLDLHKEYVRPADHSTEAWDISWDGPCAAYTSHGTLIVRPYEQKPMLGWTASRNGALLVGPDGRTVLFKRRADAQTAALLHARDGYEDELDLPDDLRWQSTH